MPGLADAGPDWHRRRDLKAMPDTELVGMAAKGDPQAFDELMVRFAPGVLGYLSLRLKNATEAEDLTQDVFVQAFRHIDMLRSPARFGPWLVSIARNKLYDHQRKHRRVTTSDGYAGLAGEGADRQAWARVADNGMGPDERASEQLVRETILEEINRLNKRYQEVLYQRLMEDQSTEEIAARLGINTDTVRTRQLRGLRKLRVLLRRRGVAL